MIGHYDGAPDPLSADRLRELIKRCEENVKILTARGMHQYAAAYAEDKRRYEKRLKKLEEAARHGN